MASKIWLLLVVLCSLGLSAAGSVGGPITITAPSDKAVITASIVRIEGTVVTRSADFGVVVNDFPAMIDWEHAGTEADPFRWFAEVPFQPGPGKITARYAQRGREGGPTAIRHIHYAPENRGVRCVPQPRIGVVPLNVLFYVQPDTDDDIVRTEIDFDGDGQYDESVAGFPNRFEHRYDQAGSRVVSLRTVYADGTTRIATSVVVPQSFTTVDAQIRKTWTAFVDALAARDVEGALAYVAASRRDHYRETLLRVRTALPQYSASVRRIAPVDIFASTAHYLLSKTEMDGTFGYSVSFSRGTDGLWHITQF